MSEPIDPDDCVFLGVNADHALYVDSGFTTDDENRDCSLDQPVLAYDRDGCNLARELASLGATVVILARCKLDDRVSARKIARLTDIVDAQLAQTDADLCDEASMLILDIEEMLAEECEIDQLEAQFRQPCRKGRA